VYLTDSSPSGVSEIAGRLGLLLRPNLFVHFATYGILSLLLILSLLSIRIVRLLMRACLLVLSVIARSGIPGDIVSEESPLDRGDGRMTRFIDPLCGTPPLAPACPTGAPALRWATARISSLEPPQRTTGEVLSAALGHERS
jgi:hypothetical protein